MPKLLVPLADGFEEIEAVTIIDVCRRAEIDVLVAGIGRRTVMGAHAIAVIADCVLDEVTTESLDMVVLPGGLGGTEILAANPVMQQLLQQMQKNNKAIGAICAAPYALAQAGVLQGPYTCYPSVAEKINVPGYDAGQRVVDAQVMTSQGAGSAMEFALAIVAKLQGSSKAKQLAQALLHV